MVHDRRRALPRPLVVTVVTSAAAYVVLTAAVVSGRTVTLDEAVYEAFRPGGTWGTIQVALAHVLALLRPAVLLGAFGVVAAGVCVRRRSWHPLVDATLLVVGTGLVVTATKWWVERADPAGGVVPHAGSYPSGHIAAVLVAVSGTMLALGVASRPWAVLLVILAWASTGLAILVVGLHWASDVAGGTLVAAALLAASALAPSRRAAAGGPPGARDRGSVVPGQSGTAESTTMRAPHPDAGFTCRGCGAPDPPQVLDLGEVPASDRFPPVDAPGPDPTWPLTLHMCPECLLVQLGPGRGEFPEPQLAVDSATALEHARSSVAEVLADEGLRPGSTLIELDSAHGASWRPHFLEAGLVEAEPSGTADLVVDVHHLMHFADLDAVLSQHAARLAPGGRLVCEFFHVLPVVEKTLIDTIRHGHFVYLSVLAARPLLARHGLVVTRARLVDVYGGSVRLTAARAADRPVVDPSVEQVVARERAAGLDRVDALEALGERGARTARAFRTHLEEQRRRGRRVAGYGAPSKAPVLLALSGVGSELLPYTVDLSPAKHGTRVPGAGVPIHPVEHLLEDRPDEVVVLTWDIADEVAGQLARTSAGSGWTPRLWVPLPTPREIAPAARRQR